MNTKYAKEQWNWKFGLLSTLLLAQIVGIVDFFVVADLDNFNVIDIYSLLSLNYLWLINCALGLILFLFFTVCLLPFILKNRISDNKIIIAYIGIPLFFMAIMTGLSVTSKFLRGLGLFNPRRITYYILIFLFAFFLSFIIIWLSIKKKRSLFHPNIIRKSLIVLITITCSAIFLISFLILAIFNYKAFPPEYRIISSNIQQGRRKISEPSPTKAGKFSPLAERKKEDQTSSSTQTRPNIIFISVDTLRADHLSCYGYKKLNTHNIDVLAKMGVKFSRAYASIPITLPSHASMMTGLFPKHHGALDNIYHFSDSNLTLAEILKDYGYTTAAIISAFPLSSRFNFHQGFDYFDNKRTKRFLILKIPFDKIKKTWIIHNLCSFHIADLFTLDRKAKDVTESAVHWLKSHHDQPFFLFIHFYDPHFYYFPPRKYLGLHYHPDTSYMGYLKSFYPLEKIYFYDGEVAYVDEEIGRLIRFFKDSGIINDSIIIFISDHGEGLGDHNYIGHTKMLYEEQLRVPLFIVFPPIIPKGKVVKNTIDIASVLPTVLDMLEIPIPTNLDCSSLLPYIFEEDNSNVSPIYAATQPYNELPFFHLGAIIKDDWKLICNFQNKKGDQLYFLPEDSGELNNLIEKEKMVANELKPLLMNWLWQTPKRSFKNLHKDREAVKRLKAIGYLQ